MGCEDFCWGTEPGTKHAFCTKGMNCHAIIYNERHSKSIYYILYECKESQKWCMIDYIIAAVIYISSKVYLLYYNYYT